MVPNVTRIRTEAGEAQIDYLSLANLPKPDATLSQEGSFADAKATGDMIEQVNTDIESLSGRIDDLDDDVVKSINGVIPDENGNVELDISHPITSVNGQTGDVKLVATDVEALPISGGELTGELSAPLINATLIQENSVALENKYAQVFKYTATLATASWSDSAPYSQTVTVTGLKSTDNVISDIDMSNISSADDGTDALDAWSLVGRIDIQDDAIVVYCYDDVPEVDIAVKMLVVGSVV